MSAKQKQHITKPQRSYFHTMLNMADDELGVYEYRLLGHYVRVAGDGGACWESTRTTAQKCRMSLGKVVSTRRALQTAGYVTIEERGDDTLYIELVDRWAENIARYAGKCSPHEHDVHHMNASVHDMNQRRTIEEEPLKGGDSAPERDYDNRPPNIARAMGDLPANMQAFVKHNSGDLYTRQKNTALQVEVSPVWKAFTAAWVKVKPMCAPHEAEDDLNHVNLLQAAIDAGKYSLDDVTACARWKLAAWKTGGALRLRYVYADMATYLETQVRKAAVSGIPQTVYLTGGDEDEDAVS